MSRARFVRFVVAAAVVSAAAASTQQPGAAPRVHDDTVPVATTYPTNAAKIFRWGNAQWVDEFVDPLKSSWSVNRKSQVRNQHGMLTVEAPATGGDTVAKLTGHGRQYGRWEARVRGRNYGTSGSPFHAVWQLSPTRDYHCGARNIVLSDYPLGTNQTTMHVRNLPNRDYTVSKTMDLYNNQFHTYAIEVTPDHISWFVDTKVIRTERRSTARTGATYDPVFRLVAKPGAKMIQGRMQMDWVRYYTLDRPNAQPITAPELTESTYADAC
jgi:hypothetical protein